MATHSSILAYRIPWMEEYGRLHGRSMGLQRVGQDRVDMANTFTPSLSALLNLFRGFLLPGLTSSPNSQFVKISIQKGKLAYIYI